jgi:hypothetical protein
VLGTKLALSRPCWSKLAIHCASLTSVSGKRIPLLVFPPLRTARETFASSSSSLSFRPFDRTRLLHV